MLCIGLSFSHVWGGSAATPITIGSSRGTASRQASLDSAAHRGRASSITSRASAQARRTCRSPADSGSRSVRVLAAPSVAPSGMASTGGPASTTPTPGPRRPTPHRATPRGPTAARTSARQGSQPAFKRASRRGDSVAVGTAAASRSISSTACTAWPGTPLSATTALTRLVSATSSTSASSRSCRPSRMGRAAVPIGVAREQGPRSGRRSASAPSRSRAASPSCPRTWVRL